MKYVPTLLVMACCVLHNLCELHGDQCEDDRLVETSSNASAIASSTATGTLTSGQQNAVAIGEALCDYFESH